MTLFSIGSDVTWKTKNEVLPCCFRFKAFYWKIGIRLPSKSTIKFTNLHLSSNFARKNLLSPPRFEPMTLPLKRHYLPYRDLHFSNQSFCPYQWTVLRAPWSCHLTE